MSFTSVLGLFLQTRYAIQLNLNGAIEMEPFYQGALDSLCGVYSIVNAVRKVTKTIDSQEQFAEIINYLDSKRDLCKIIIFTAHRN